ncbi:MAG: hypothetical protein DRI46_08050 [Chloroflexi bacterium]|nr:MAG: hypothetical protein DRI46_08050 [Chloroflexota bacterium]
MLIIGKDAKEALEQSKAFDNWVVTKLMAKGLSKRLSVYADMFERRGLPERIDDLSSMNDKSIVEYICDGLTKAAYSSVPGFENGRTVYTPLQQKLDWVLRNETSLYSLMIDFRWPKEHSYIIQEYRMNAPYNEKYKLAEVDVNRIVDKLNLYGAYKAVEQGYSYGLYLGFSYFGPTKDQIEAHLCGSQDVNFPSEWGWRSDT